MYRQIINRKSISTCMVIICVLLVIIVCCSAVAAQPGSDLKVKLTEEERLWLDENPEKLVLYYNTEFPPIEFSSESGTFSGMGADVVARVEEMLSLSFIKIPSDDWNEHLAALQSGECAIAPTIVRTPEREDYAYFTTPYATVPVVIITVNTITDRLVLEELSGWRIGVVSGYATEKFLRDQALLSYFKVVPVENVAEGLQGVSFGQLNAFVENLAVAAYYIEELGIPNLRVAGETDFKFAWSIGVSREYPLLYSSIQKALDEMTAAELAQIKNEWISLDLDPGLDPEEVMLIQVAAFFVALLLASLAGITLFLKNRLNQKVAAIRESEVRAKQQRSAIAGLVRDDLVVSGELKAALRRITEVLAHTISVERASIWFLAEEDTELRCISLFEAENGKHSEGDVLLTKNMPSYFEAISAESRIYSENAQSDLRTSELAEIYLKPLNISSLLDAGIILNGVLKGVVSLEHVGDPRKWHADEEAFASTAASMVAQLLINTERIKINDSLQSQLQFEKMVSSISAYFVGMPAEALDERIYYALQLAGEYFLADRSYIVTINEDGSCYSVTHEWCADGISPQMGRNQNVPVANNPWWVEQMHNSRHVYVYDIEKLPPAAAKDKEDFQKEGIKSILTLPITREGETFGFFGLDAVRENRVWHNEQIDLLHLVAELISGAFTQYIAYQKVRYMSFHDSLTGLYNRVYLEQEMARLDTARQLPISFIMADLNGLKLVNDTYGHEKGDILLKTAAEVITRSCREEDIIARWGGDEFTILLPLTTFSEALTICNRISANCLKASFAEMPLSIALGVASKIDETTSQVEVLREAEDNMYKQKLTESRSTKSAVLRALLKTLAEKSFETEAHTRRMQEIAKKIGVNMLLPDAELSRLELLITLHDIGKINISEEILTKNTSLTTDEWEKIKRHPEIGFRLARATEEFAHVAEDILSHHERWDGAGYPRGLKGKDIPLLARITTVADAFEVMSNGRPYKAAMNNSEIVDEFIKCSGSQFDPELVEALLSIINREQIA
jgi:diguanylate cyclase (GGDEF)-like protein